MAVLVALGSATGVKVSGVVGSGSVAGTRSVGVGVAVSPTMLVGVAVSGGTLTVSVAVGVALTTGVSVASGVAVASGVSVAVGVSVSTGVLVALGVSVLVGVAVNGITVTLAEALRCSLPTKMTLAVFGIVPLAMGSTAATMLIRRSSPGTSVPLVQRTVLPLLSHWPLKPPPSMLTNWSCASSWSLTLTPVAVSTLVL